MHFDAIDADRSEAADDADDADRSGVDLRCAGAANAAAARGPASAADAAIARLVSGAADATVARLVSGAADAAAGFPGARRVIEFRVLRIDADRRRPGRCLEQQGEEGGKETAFHRSGSLAWRCSSAL